MSQLSFYAEGTVFIPFKCGCVLGIEGDMNFQCEDGECDWDRFLDSYVACACDIHGQILHGAGFVNEHNEPEFHPDSDMLLQMAAAVWEGAELSFEDFVQMFIANGGRPLNPFDPRLYGEPSWCTLLEELRSNGRWTHCDEDEKALYQKLCASGPSKPTDQAKKAYKLYIPDLIYEADVRGNIIFSCGCSLDITAILSGLVCNGYVKESIDKGNINYWELCDEHEYLDAKIERIQNDDDKVATLLRKIAKIDSCSDISPLVVVPNLITMGTVGWEVIGPSDCDCMKSLFD